MFVTHALTAAMMLVTTLGFVFAMRAVRQYFDTEGFLALVLQYSEILLIASNVLLFVAFVSQAALRLFSTFWKKEQLEDQ